MRPGLFIGGELKMIVEKHANGRIELWLSPESEIDAVFVNAIAERASKGQSIQVMAEGEKLVISVSQK